MKLKSGDGSHDCLASGCDVSWDGESITGHRVTYTTPAGVEVEILIPKGGKMPWVGDPTHPNAAGRPLIPPGRRHTVKVTPL